MEQTKKDENIFDWMADIKAKAAAGIGATPQPAEAPSPVRGSVSSTSGPMPNRNTYKAGNLDIDLFANRLPFRSLQPGTRVSLSGPQGQQALLDSLKRPSGARPPGSGNSLQGSTFGARFGIEK